MEHQLFKPRSFDEGMANVVGNCNGFTKEERWEKETPLFAEAILRRLPEGGRTLLDYGCGVGRIAREILALDSDATVIGVDTSEAQLAFAREYVGSGRFVGIAPVELSEQIDLAYSIYVLQHIPAVEFRDALQRIHYFLRKDGLFICCSSDYRMAIRFDQPGFFDDRFLGLNIREEIGRYFDPVSDLFTSVELDQNPLVRTMVTGQPGDQLAHPAVVYSKRTLCVPQFNY